MGVLRYLCLRLKVWINILKILLNKIKNKPVESAEFEDVSFLFLRIKYFLKIKKEMVPVITEPNKIEQNTTAANSPFFKAIKTLDFVA